MFKTAKERVREYHEKAKGIYAETHPDKKAEMKSILRNMKHEHAKSAAIKKKMAGKMSYAQYVQSRSPSLRAISGELREHKHKLVGYPTKDYEYEEHCSTPGCGFKKKGGQKKSK